MKLSAQIKPTHEQPQETLALLKILALGQTQMSEGRVKPLDQAVSEIKARHRSVKLCEPFIR